MWQTLRKRQGWFKVWVNLVMIFVGMQFIDFAFQMQFGDPKQGDHLKVLTAMYLAFIGGLFPNYASTLADELRTIDRRSLKQVGEVLLFFFVVLALNIGVVWLGFRL